MTVPSSMDPSPFAREHLADALRRARGGARVAVREALVSRVTRYRLLRRHDLMAGTFGDGEEGPEHGA